MKEAGEERTRRHDWEIPGTRTSFVRIPRMSWGEAHGRERGRSQAPRLRPAVGNSGDVPHSSVSPECLGESTPKVPGGVLGVPTSNAEAQMRRGRKDRSLFVGEDDLLSKRCHEPMQTEVEPVETPVAAQKGWEIIALDNPHRDVQFPRPHAKPGGPIQPDGLWSPKSGGHMPFAPVLLKA